MRSLPLPVKSWKPTAFSCRPYPLAHHSHSCPYPDSIAFAQLFPWLVSPSPARLQTVRLA